MVRVWARYTDRMRSNPIIARNQGGTLDHFGAGDTGGSGQCPTGRTFCVVLTLKRRCLKSCRDDEVFFKLSSTPEYHALRGHTAFGS
jgi:hypothetical protein